MNTDQKEHLKAMFGRYPSVGIAYFFGSRARGDEGPLSDYDFAIYADESDPKKLFELKLALLTDISRILQTDAVDIVMLNTTKNASLKYRAILEGEVLFERSPFRVLIEPRMFNEYFDYRALLSHNRLTR